MKKGAGLEWKMENGKGARGIQLRFRTLFIPHNSYFIIAPLVLLAFPVLEECCEWFMGLLWR